MTRPLLAVVASTGDASGMPRIPPAARYALAWLPVWALYALLISPSNPVHTGGSFADSSITAIRSITIAALLGVVVRRLTQRFPWPVPFRPWFIVGHAVGTTVYATLWFTLAALVETVFRPGAIDGYRAMMVPNLVLGAWLYLIIVGAVYTVQATERAARAEAEAARAQLAALRAQLNPHFLFNALHSVVHLIPSDPALAARAAQQVADLLRATIDEDREVVTVADEAAFVERYLDVERLRFGDRLRVEVDIDAGARRADIPAFAVQALVENAVRHGAAPRVQPTTIRITGRVDVDRLVLTVRDDGAGAREDMLQTTNGTGLRRLRARLETLYGTAARLDVRPAEGGGLEATLTLPVEAE